MKIGVLTLPFNNNYGGYLQAYALLTVLKQLGHTVCLINRRENYHRASIVNRCKNFIKYYIFGKSSYFNTQSRENCFRLRGKKMMPFVDKYIAPRTERFFSSKDLKNVKRYNFDALIVGSDQVWRPVYVPNIEDFYFAFAKDWKIKRLSYAASFGTDAVEYSENEQKICGSLLKLFDAVSVREKGGKSIIEKEYKWKIQPVVSVHVDPTMLLGKEYYKQFITPQKENNIFCYILDGLPSKRSSLEAIARQLECTLSVYYINGDSLPSIEEWLSSIWNATYVITDSFHGTVFSILFNKPFIALSNSSRGASRFDSLLETFDLKNRLYYNLIVENSIELLKKNLDWNEINNKLEEERRRSISYLKENLI